MVAYSFKKRFVPLIESGAKAQTIRGTRARHARVGEPVQLFFGMRTKQCRKIIPDPVCTFVGKIKIDFMISQIGIWGPVVGETTSLTLLFGPALDPFAQADGFEDWADMRFFWRKEYGASVLFQGTLIKWEPRHG